MFYKSSAVSEFPTLTNTEYSGSAGHSSFGRILCIFVVHLVEKGSWAAFFSCFSFISFSIDLLSRCSLHSGYESTASPFSAHAADYLSFSQCTQLTYFIRQYESHLFITFTLSVSTRFRHQLLIRSSITCHPHKHASAAQILCSARPMLKTEGTNNTLWSLGLIEEVSDTSHDIADFPAFIRSSSTAACFLSWFIPCFLNSKSSQTQFLLLNQLKSTISWSWFRDNDSTTTTSSNTTININTHNSHNTDTVYNTELINLKC